MKFKTNFITILEFRKTHPETLVSDSDAYFTSLANRILRALLPGKSTTEGLSEHLLRQFALKSAAYLEDVVSSWGLFDGFRKLHLQMFGKKLPFYTLDEDYYDDEINFEDIQFLIWTTIQEDINETEGGRFLNPENPGIALVSELIFCILEEEYETAPENEHVRELLHEREYDDFFSLRKLLKWLCYNTYLSTNNAKNTLEEMKISVRKIDNGSLPLQTANNLIYLIESNSIFNHVCTPLSVNAIEWFRAITTNKNTLKKSENLACRAFQSYKIISSNKETINLLPFCENEPMLQLDRESLNYLDKNSSREFQAEKETIQTALVFFDGLWQVNGMSIFTAMDDRIQTEENKKNAHKKQHAENVEYSHKEIFKYNKNKPIAFFKDYGKWKKFWLGIFPDTPNIEDYSGKTLFKNERNILLFSHPRNGAVILPDAATLIKYPSNKLYNKGLSEENGIALLTGDYPAPLEFLEFIIDNNYIPDARINSLKGVEYGRRLVQDNQWFIVRFFQPKLFESNIFDDLPVADEEFD